jgi:hypothetical protein
MVSVRTIVIATFVFLLFGFSLNAYACLIPVGVQTMEGNCSTPDEQPPNQFCETFKLLGFGSTEDTSKLCQLGVVEPALSWESLCSYTLHERIVDASFRFHGPPIKTTVLRI